MLLNKKILYIVGAIIPFSTVSVVSCSSSSTSNNFAHSDEYKAIMKFKNEKQINLFSKPKNDKKLLSVITLKNENSNSFLSSVKEYLDINNEFEQYLNNNSSILESIKKITISPFESKKDVRVNVYLNSAQNDSNLISEEIKDYLVDNFSYSKIITISKQENPIIISSDEFNQQFKKLKEYSDLSLLEKAFKLTNQDVEYIKSNQPFDFEENYYTLTIKIKHEKYLEGVILLNNEAYYPELTSNKLVAK